MNRRKLTTFQGLIAMLIVALLGTACAPFLRQISSPGQQRTQSAPLPNTGNVVPAVLVQNQEFDGTTVVVAEVVSDGPGWLVIHNQENGTVGPPIGFTSVKSGGNKNVTVKVDPDQATPVMYAMLHADAGEVGTYEFPGLDVPVSVDGQMVNPEFAAMKHDQAAEITPAVTINSQEVVDGKVTIAEVDSRGPGWIAIHVQNPDGSPGIDIGFKSVKSGKNLNVVVTVDPTKVTPVMFAMLHVDAGEVNTYEFPGPDVPIEINGVMLAPSFTTTGAPQANAAATGTPVAMDHGEPTATTSPQPTETTAPTETSAPVASPTPEHNMVMQTPSSNVVPLVLVTDQALDNGMVKVTEVVSDGPGWIVIYTTNANGQPDQAIGHTAVQAGDNQNVMVQVDPALAQGRLIAQLHADAGAVGAYEFPGADGPVMIGAQMIAGMFTISAPQASAPTSTPEGIVDSIKVANQPIVDSSVVVPEVISNGDAWVVIHRQNGDGTMGAMVGFAKVQDGNNANVVVKVDTNFTSTTMYAMLHADRGQADKLEFPGEDVPVEVNGQMVLVPFSITTSGSSDVVINASQDTTGSLHLIDGKGMSLYLSLNDPLGQSNCTEDCLTVWRPFRATGRIIAGSGVANNKLGVIVLPDGTRQVTYAGAPLYTYTGDANPGDINGQGIDGSWFLVTP